MTDIKIGFIGLGSRGANLLEDIVLGQGEHVTAVCDSYADCIFRKNCASVPEERSAIPLQTEQSSAG